MTTLKYTLLKFNLKSITFLNLSSSSEYVRKIYRLADFIIAFANYEHSRKKQKDNLDTHAEPAVVSL